jgi:hypothetical protein
MLIYQLEAEEHLSKIYRKTDTELTKAPYPMVWPFTSHTKEVNTIEGFSELLKSMLQQPNLCLVKGVLNRTLVSESRAGSTDPNTPTQWLCLDLDHVPLKGEDELTPLLAQMGLGDTSYVLQYGAGHLIDKNFSAHLFFLLDAPVLPSQLKLWLMQQNLTIPSLREHIELTKSDCALRWPIDISLAQNDKLIYTAPPSCHGFKDPVSERVKFCKGARGKAKLAKIIKEVPRNVTEAEKDKLIAELRKKKGLPRKTFSYKEHGDVKLLSNPDKGTVTGVKNERGFTYINLNNGDSWGYYFPQENPEVVYNFKGEPNYPLKKLDPEFYQQYKQALTQSGAEGREQVPFAFLDRRTDKYFRGTYSPETEQIEIYSTDSLKKLEDFAKQNGLFLGDYVEEWDYQFQFDNDKVFDPKGKFVNRYRQTPYLRRSINGMLVPSDLPPTISKVLYSVVGGDAECVYRLVNWLACIVQYRQRTQTAWVFTGREGTGKGVLFNYILAPLLGPEYCRTTRLSTLEEDFNPFMEDCVLLMIDESKTSQIKNYEKVMALLKNVIVEPRIQIRRMRTDAYMATNYMNLIVASNHPDAIHISPTDRRFNVGVYQPNKLNLTEHDIERIQEELWDFAIILRVIKADQELARIPLVNEARERMMYLTETSISVAARAIMEGNLEFFIDSLPSDDYAVPSGYDIAGQVSQDRYVAVLREAERYAAAGEPMRLTREQCKVLMDFVVGDTPKTANKFTNFMKHYGIFFSRKRKSGKIVQCLDVPWKRPTVQVDDFVGSEGKPGTVKVVK